MKPFQDVNGRWLGPATDQAIQQAEEALGVPMPSQYREFLLRYGSGVLGPTEIYGLGGPRHGVPHLLWLVEDLAELGLRRPHQLIPFCAEGDGTYSAILAAPLAGQPTGSVVYWSPRPDEVLDIRPAYPSLDDWFAVRLGTATETP